MCFTDGSSAEDMDIEYFGHLSYQTDFYFFRLIEKSETKNDQDEIMDEEKIEDGLGFLS